jgi:hypothetical protein
VIVDAMLGQHGFIPEKQAFSSMLANLTMLAKHLDAHSKLGLVRVWVALA